MFYFFAKFGSRPWAKYIMPGVGAISTVSYYLCHTYLHDQVRNLLAAQSPDGSREEISDALRELITKTYIEAQVDFMIPKVENKFLAETKPPPIKWFASSTLEPITFGMSEMKTGILIGLPSYYNYENPGDIPDSVFQIKKISLFRSPQDPELNEEMKEKEKIANFPQNSENSDTIRKIDRNSEEGKEFSNSLLLTEEAKKFSIARELFLSDTYRPMFKTVIISLCFTTALHTSRASVVFLKVADKHLSQRLPGYATSGLLGYGMYRFIIKALDDRYAKEADTRAKKLGEVYERGALEYYSKRTRRRMILDLE